MLEVWDVDVPIRSEKVAKFMTRLKLFMSAFGQMLCQRICALVKRGSFMMKLKTFCISEFNIDLIYMLMCMVEFAILKTGSLMPAFH